MAVLLTKPHRSPVAQQYRHQDFRKSSGSLEMFAAIRRASLLFVVSLLEFGRTRPHTLRVKPAKLDSAFYYKVEL
jgi:hypothetical protein